jgi:hypothetical protein
MKKPRAKLAPTVPGIFIQAVAREPDHRVPTEQFPFPERMLRELLRADDSSEGEAV